MDDDNVFRFPKRNLPGDEEEAFVIAKRKLHEAIFYYDELQLYMRRGQIDGYDLQTRLSSIHSEVTEAMDDLAASMPNDHEPPPESGVRSVG